MTRDPAETVMRAHGWHHWTDKTRGQRFWCRCPVARDHSTEPNLKTERGSQ